MTTWRTELQQALGANARLIADIVPQVELLIGPQAAIAPLPPLEAQNRFHIVLRQLVAVVARKEHPLALFLDDLQWIDPESLKLIEHILLHPQSRYLLLLGAYRDNEVGPSHPLMLTRDSLRKAGVRMHEIFLAPLTAPHLTRFIADALRCSPERAAPLSRLVHEKTAGNPFFAIQFLTSLHQEGLLALDRGAREWRWDEAKIHRKGFTDNVVDLMVRKLKRLPASTQEASMLAACVGSTTDLHTLAVISDRSDEQTERDLQEAVQEGLMLRHGDVYTFLHDRVQQGAYALIDDDKKKEVHLRIGRLLLASLPPGQVEERIFDVVAQLDHGADLLTDPAEKDELARLDRALSATYASFARDSRNEAVYQTIRLEQQFLACLQGRTRGIDSFEDASFQEGPCLAEITGAAFMCGVVFYHTMKLLTAYLFGDEPAALRHAAEAKKALPAAMAMPMEATFYYVHALVLARSHARAGEDARVGIIGTLKEYDRKLEFWASMCPENFRTRHALVSAEIARITGDELAAERRYEEAIRAARESGFVHWEGLACELAAGFHRGRGFETIAMAYLRDALHAYARWGADAKVRQLEQRDPALRELPAPGPAATFAAAADAGKFAGDDYFARARPRSVLCVPILRQSEVVGLLYLENNLLAGAFTHERLAALELLATQAAISLQNARLLAEERAARAEAEEAGRRAAFLAEAGAILSESLDYQETFRRLGPLCARALGSWCVIDIVEGQQIQRLAGAHVDPAMEPALAELQRRYPPGRDSGHPAATVLRSGEPLLLAEVPDELLRQVCVDDGHFRLLRALGTASALAVPLVVRGQTLGVITVASCAPERRYGRADLELAMEVARRAASAIDNARIFGRFERAVPTRHYGGLGLGLYISRRIVEEHGGSIRCESQPGAGATFVFELPRERSPLSGPRAQHLEE